MRAIAIAAAAIGLGLSVGLAAPYVADKVRIDIKTVASAPRHTDMPTADPEGLVGASEAQPRTRVAAPQGAKTPPHPEHKSEPPRVPTRIARQIANTKGGQKVDCRKYVPKAQVTIAVPCDGKSEGKETGADDERKDKKKSRKESRSTGSGTDEDEEPRPGTCRQYVTRAGLTVIQTVPCRPGVTTARR